MTGLWAASYAALWLFMLFIGTLVFFLFRAYGLQLLHTAKAVSDQGLPLNAVVPDFEFEALDGSAVRLRRAGKAAILVFGSRRCPACKLLLPHLERFAVSVGDVNVYFVLDEDAASARLTASELKVTNTPVLCSRSSFDTFKVQVTPFVYALDGAGVLRSKGLANTEAALQRYRRHVIGEHGVTRVPAHLGLEEKA